MLQVFYKPSFVRQMKNLPKDLFDEIFEKIDLLRDEENHPALKVHKLQGKLSGKWSFSVNYRDRIVFQYESKNEIVLLAFGDHNVYR